MRLPVKLSLLLSAATCFPLLLATAFTLPRGRAALRSQLDEIYAQDARTLAGEVHRTLVDKLDSLTLAASTLRLHELDPEAREQALLLIYKETRGADIVGLFDSRADAVGNIIRFARLQGVLASEHEPIDDAALSMYAGKVPLQGALQAGLAIGPVYILPDAEGRPIPRLVLAVAVPGPARTPPYRSWGGRRWCRSPPPRRWARCAISPATPISGSLSASWSRCSSDSARFARSRRRCRSCARRPSQSPAARWKPSWT